MFFTKTKRTVIFTEFLTFHWLQWLLLLLQNVSVVPFLFYCQIWLSQWHVICTAKHCSGAIWKVLFYMMREASLFNCLQGKLKQTRNNAACIDASRVTGNSPWCWIVGKGAGGNAKINLMDLRWHERSHKINDMSDVTTENVPPSLIYHHRMMNLMYNPA